MDYFAGLDISMDETHVCVLDREGVVVRESKTESTAQAIAGELAKAPSCHRIVFETGRMRAHPVSRVEPLGLPVVLRREPAGLPGAASRSPPTRPISTTPEDWRTGSHRLLSPFMPSRCKLMRSARLSLRAISWLASGDLGKPHPRPGRRVRILLPRARRSLHRSGPARQARIAGLLQRCRDRLRREPQRRLRSPRSTPT